MAATIVPTAALAQQQTAPQDRTQVRTHQRTTQANRQTVRSNQRVARSNQNVARSNQRVARSNQNVARTNQRVARTAQRARSAYVAPVRNWSYRPVNVGYRLQPSFYGSNYYISDYGAYHLQSPRNRFTRWIRYGNDLLLVNIRTGRVLQVIHYDGW
jgi:Ni/Co efflux regulator RcnB